MNKRSDTIYSHYYPSWLLRSPRLIHILYYLNYFLHLRKWYIKSAINKEIQNIDFGFRLLDAGVGEGQFLIPLAKKYSKGQFTGIDKLAGHQMFCASYAKTYHLQNVQFQTSDLEEFKSDDTFDMIFCIGVLQYIQNDLLVLENFYQHLKNGGKLLLYIPVHNRSILPFYRSLSKKLSNYETVQERQRIYTKHQVESMLINLGFNIDQLQNTYGYFGIISNELINTYLMLFNKSSFFLRLGLTLLFILIYPIILLLMVVDYVLPKSMGNGLLVIARK